MELFLHHNSYTIFTSQSPVSRYGYMWIRRCTKSDWLIIQKRGTNFLLKTLVLKLSLSATKYARYSDCYKCLYTCVLTHPMNRLRTMWPLDTKAIASTSRREERSTLSSGATLVPSLTRGSSHMSKKGEPFLI